MAYLFIGDSSTKDPNRLFIPGENTKKRLYIGDIVMFNTDAKSFFCKYPNILNSFIITRLFPSGLMLIQHISTYENNYIKVGINLELLEIITISDLVQHINSQENWQVSKNGRHR